MVFNIAEPPGMHVQHLVPEHVDCFQKAEAAQERGNGNGNGNSDTNRNRNRNGVPATDLELGNAPTHERPNPGGQVPTAADLEPGHADTRLNKKKDP